MPSIIEDLAVANRILAREGVVDAFGHVSARHPDDPERYLLSCSRSPEIVCAGDIMEYRLDDTPIDQRDRAMYAERPIHGAIYQARPDVTAVIHNHSNAVIPFGVTRTPLRQILHVAGGMGEEVPLWDIRDRFGDTDMLVTTQDQGRDLAAALGDASAVLMRGHGCVVASLTLKRAVLCAVYLEVNARLLIDSLRLSSEVRYMSEGEVRATAQMTALPLVAERTWDYWRARANLDGL